MNAAKEEFGGVWRKGVREAACTCAMPYMAISWWSAWRSERLGRRPLAICEKKRNKRAKKRMRRVAGLNAEPTTKKKERDECVDDAYVVTELRVGTRRAKGWVSAMTGIECERRVETVAWTLTSY